MGVPVVSIPRESFRLRPYIISSLDLIFGRELGEDTLIFVDDLDLQGLGGAKNVQVSLVDHNVPVGPARTWGHPIVTVVDHHHCSGGSRPGYKVLEAGSCCSIVALEWRGFVQEHPSHVMDRAHCALLLLAIVFDTSFFNSSSTRITDVDREAIEFLCSVSDVTLSEIEKLYMRVYSVYSNDSGGPMGDAVRSDYKSYTTPNLNFGICSLRLSLQGADGMLGRELELLNSLGDLCAEKNVEFIVLMCVSLPSGGSGSISREFAICLTGSLVTDGLCRHRSLILGRMPNLPELRCELVDVRRGIYRDAPIELHAYSQKNALTSRKILAPVILSLLSGDSH